MKPFAKILLVTGLILGFSVHAATAVEFRYADAEKAREILLAQEEYYNRMSSAEIAIRMKSTTADKMATDLKALYAENTLDWTEEEIAQFQSIVDANKAGTDRIAHLLPEVIYFIRGTSNIEGGLPHTHANAIIIQNNIQELNSSLFIHEIFHVLSRNHTDKHGDLYSLIGFKGCVLNENQQLMDIHLTNPDVPVRGYYLPAKIDGEDGAIMPFLYATRPAFDSELAGGFPGHFGFGLLNIAVENGVCNVVADADGNAQFFNPDEIPEFFAAIGRNSTYIIHPEEVLANTLVYLLLDTQDLPNPEIVKRLGQWIDETGKE